MNQSVFIQRIRSILVDNASERWVHAQRCGPRLDEARLALVPSGNDRIFQRQPPATIPEYHVHFCLDASGSMNGARQRAASAAVHSLSWALQQAGCQVQTAVFGNHVRMVPPETVADIHKLYAYASDNPCGGGTKDYLAIDRGRASLQGLQGKRILCVITDGGSDDADTLRARLLAARREGITILAIGIYTGVHFPGVYGPRWSRLIDSEVAGLLGGEDLGSRLHTMLSSLLMAQYQRGE